MDAAGLFEAELRRRGIAFWRPDEFGRYTVALETGRVLVSLQNLEREMNGNGGDLGRVSFFTDVVVASNAARVVVAEQLLWCLEPNDYAEPPPYRVAVSPQLNRVLAEVGADQSWLRWLTPSLLNAVGLSEADAFERAWSNLDAELRRATIRTEVVDGVVVAYLDTRFVWKASLLLAPGLRDAVGPIVGWPVLAIAPDRNFALIWNAERPDFVPRMAQTVTREYGRAPYPLTTEVLELGDSVRAIGAFAKNGREADHDA